MSANWWWSLVDGALSDIKNVATEANESTRDLSWWECRRRALNIPSIGPWQPIDLGKDHLSLRWLINYRQERRYCNYSAAILEVFRPVEAIRYTNYRSIWHSPRAAKFHINRAIFGDFSPPKDNKIRNFANLFVLCGANPLLDIHEIYALYAPI